MSIPGKTFGFEVEWLIKVLTQKCVSGINKALFWIHPVSHLVITVAVAPGEWSHQALCRTRSSAPLHRPSWTAVTSSAPHQPESCPDLQCLLLYLCCPSRRSQILWGWDLIHYPFLKGNLASRKWWNNTERKYFKEKQRNKNKCTHTHTHTQKANQATKAKLTRVLSSMIMIMSIQGWSLGRCSLLSWDADAVVGQWKQVSMEGMAKGGGPPAPSIQHSFL